VLGIDPLWFYSRKKKDVYTLYSTPFPPALFTVSLEAFNQLPCRIKEVRNDGWESVV